MSEQPEQVAPTMTDAEVSAAQLPAATPVVAAAEPTTHVCKVGYCDVCGKTTATTLANVS